MSDETKTIELWPCGYDARCNVRNCKAKATKLVWSTDSGGRPIKQYELCSVHTDQVAQREKLKGREIVRSGGGVKHERQTALAGQHRTSDRE